MLVSSIRGRSFRIVNVRLNARRKMTDSELPRPYAEAKRKMTDSELHSLVMKRTIMTTEIL